MSVRNIEDSLYNNYSHIQTERELKKYEYEISSSDTESNVTIDSCKQIFHIHNAKNILYFVKFTYNGWSCIKIGCSRINLATTLFNLKKELSKLDENITISILHLCEVDIDSIYDKIICDMLLERDFVTLTQKIKNSGKIFVIDYENISQLLYIYFDVIKQIYYSKSLTNHIWQNKYTIVLSACCLLFC